MSQVHQLFCQVKFHLGNLPGGPHYQPVVVTVPEEGFRSRQALAFEFQLMPVVPLLCEASRVFHLIVRKAGLIVLLLSRLVLQPGLQAMPWRRHRCLNGLAFPVG